jgi:hypothetical protein
MENLTAFVRERTQRTEADRTAKSLDQRVAAIAYSSWEKAGKPEGRNDEIWGEAVRLEPFGEPPPTDIEAVLKVIRRRSEKYHALQTPTNRLDLRKAVLRRANLGRAHLEYAELDWAYLNGANLAWANLHGADFRYAHLHGANLMYAHLEVTNFDRAHLEGAIVAANLQGSYLTNAHLEGADLSRAEGLTQPQIDGAFGDAKTLLPEGLTRPANWTDPTAPRAWWLTLSSALHHATDPAATH